MEIQTITRPKAKETDQEKVMNGMMSYMEGKKEHKQLLSRAFLAGVRLGKNLKSE